VLVVRRATVTSFEPDDASMVREQWVDPPSATTISINNYRNGASVDVLASYETQVTQPV
jgi:hypothetical protein